MPKAGWLLVLFCGAGTASAADPTPAAWSLARVTTASRDGLTQFQVLEADERGGRVRIIRSPRDVTCPGGATYLMGWRIEGEARRVGVGQTLTISFEGHQTAGERCPTGEPLARAAAGLGAIEPGWAPGTFLSFEGPSAREFYLHPEDEGIRDRHLGRWLVSVPASAHQAHLYMVIGIDTSGNSGGQWFNYGLLYDAEQRDAPPLPPPPAPPPATPGAMPPSRPPAGGAATPSTEAPPSPIAPAPPAFAINPAWLTTYYYRTSYYGTAYTFTLTAIPGGLEGRIRTTGAMSDPRRLYNFRLLEPDVLVGEWESDPAFDYPEEGKRGRGRGTFRADFYPSSGKTFYIMFKVGPGNEMDTGIAEMANSWLREPR